MRRDSELGCGNKEHLLIQTEGKRKKNENERMGT